MDLIQALKQANGKPVRRMSWPSLASCVETKDNDVIWVSNLSNAIGCVDIDNYLADDWYVVEPKSKIEEIIRREVADYFGVSPMAMASHRSQVAEAMRRVVNLALDEATAIISSNVTDCESCEKFRASLLNKINTLKVKV